MIKKTQQSNDLFSTDNVQDQVLTSETEALAPAETESRFKFADEKIILSKSHLARIIALNQQRFKEGAEYFKEVSQIKKIKSDKFIYALAVMINNDLEGLPVRDLKPITDWNREGFKVNKGEKMIYADKSYHVYDKKDENGEETDEEVHRIVTYRLFHRSQVTKATAEELEKFNKKRQKLADKKTGSKKSVKKSSK